MNLDVRTMYMAMAATCSIVAMALFIMYAGRFRRDGTLLWSAGWVLQGIFWTLLGLRGLIWDFVSIVVAHTFLAASFSLLYAAVRQFQNRTYNPKTLLLPPIATFVFFWYFSVYADNISYRTIFISLLCILQIIVIVRALFRDNPNQERRSCWLTGFAFLLMALIFFSRLLHGITPSYGHLSVLEPTTFGNGSVIGALGVVILSSIGFLLMIQERAAEMLAANQAALKTIIESTPDSISMKDRDGRYVIVNSAGANFLSQATGISASEFIGKKDKDIFTPEVARQVMETDHQVITSGKMQIYDQPSLVDGDSRIFSTIKSPCFDAGGKTCGIVSVSRDITDRKEMERALRESEQRFRSLVETTSDWVWEVNEKGVYTYASPKVKELLGYDPGEVIGKKPFDFMPLEVADRMSQLFKGIVTSRKPFTRLENTNVHKDGHLVVLETSGVPILEKDGKFAGYRGIDRDITERKRAEEDLKNFEVRVQRMEKMEALGTLAGGVAHDLNNILSGIVGYPDLILAELPGDSPLRESILAIKRSGQKASALVQDLMMVARRGMVSTEVVNWNSLISDYMKSPEHEKIQSLHPHVGFEVLLESDLLPMKGSRVHLSNTLMNLLSNAAEAMPESGGIVTILTRNHYLKRPVKGYDAVKEGDYVVLEISDTGRGISPEVIGRIFEPFYTRKVTGRSGTGLGLAVVWGTVKDHGGYIDVQSEEGTGTKFTLYFPVTMEASTLDQSQITFVDYMGKGETILVIESVKEERELLVAMLNKLNYRVISVSSAEAAIETVETWQPDLIILDMLIEPGMDGLETYRRILKLRPGQKAIIASGSETERVRQALDLGAGAFVEKPYAMAKIAEVVRRELDKCSRTPQ
jgi:PAS domain S-box-containing protein